MKAYFYFNRFTDKVDTYAADDLVFTGTVARRKNGGDFDPFTTEVDISVREDGLFADKRAALVYGIEVAAQRQNRYAGEIAILHRRIEGAEALEQYLRRTVEYEDRLMDGSIDIETPAPADMGVADF